MVEDADGTDNLASLLDLVWEVGWICHHKFTFGHLTLGLHTNSLPILKDHLIHRFVLYSALVGAFEVRVWKGDGIDKK